MESFASSPSEKIPVYYNTDGTADCLSAMWTYACEPSFEYSDDVEESDVGYESCMHNGVSRGFITQKHDFGSEIRNTAMSSRPTLEEELYRFWDPVDVKYNCTCEGIAQTISTSRTANLEWIQVEGNEAGYASTIAEIGAALHTSREDFKESR